MVKEKDKVGSFIGPSARFEGKLSFDGTVRLDGRFTGEIEGKSGTLVIGESGFVDALVCARRIIVSGEVRGSINAEDGIEVYPPARVFADMKAPAILIEEGVVFQGSCSMLSIEDSVEKDVDRSGS
ncbi:MAG: polymer-forming cytoskeletal protein [Pseudomonadota bacterium]